LRKEKPYDYCDRSSFLVLMLLEFCCGLPKAQGDELLQRYYHEIVLGLDSYGKKSKDTRSLDLMGWSRLNLGWNSCSRKRSVLKACR